MKLEMKLNDIKREDKRKASYRNDDKFALFDKQEQQGKSQRDEYEKKIK